MQTKPIEGLHMILASQSPRRYELLSDAGFSLEVVPEVSKQ